MTNKRKILPCKSYSFLANFHKTDACLELFIIIATPNFMKIRQTDYSPKLWDRQTDWQPPVWFALIILCSEGTQRWGTYVKRTGWEPNVWFIIADSTKFALLQQTTVRLAWRHVTISCITAPTVKLLVKVPAAKRTPVYVATCRNKPLSACRHLVVLWNINV
jgi:hypothetical protein